MSPRLSRVGVCVAGLMLASGAAAQTSRLYVTALLDPDVPNGGIAVLQSHNLLFKFPTVQFEERAIAISGDVRTASLRPASYPPGADDGHRYDLNGNYLGQAYPATSADLFSSDGTTDGQHNYGITAGALYQYDRDWQNPAPLFSSPVDRPFTRGVTYDPYQHTFWILTEAFNPVTGFDVWVDEFDYAGQRLQGSLVHDPVSGLPAAQNRSALAFDPADRTLWIVDEGYLAQVDRTTGAIMDAFLHPYLLINPPGAEFDLGLVPAPGAAGLLVLAGACALRRRR
jgi:hypothetical protein